MSTTHGGASPSPEVWSLIEKTADHVWESGIAQEHRYKHRSSVVLILLKGWELGLPLMSALEHVRLIHGHFSLSAESLQALALARVPGSRFQWIAEGKGGVAEVAAERPGHARLVVRFTHEDAVKTGMADKNPLYQRFPANLLRSAAMRHVCRRMFPDVILGLDQNTEVSVEGPDGERPSEPPAAVAGAPSGVDERDRPTEPPSDAVLPFTSGRWQGQSLSGLDASGLGAMFRGFSKRLTEAKEAGDESRIETISGWLTSVLAWATFRGLSEEQLRLPSEAA
jgi:hypothetical protein